jgi:iron transport multicopper oxidase
MPGLISQFQSTANSAGAEPIPDTMLMNDGEDATYPVEAGKTYLFRILNIGAFPSFYFNIADHDFQIVEMDGVYTARTTASSLYIGNAMRYTILVTTKSNATTNFDISGVADKGIFPSPGFQGESLVVSGSLQYDAKEPEPESRTEAEVTAIPVMDDITVPPLDGETIVGPVDKQIVLNFEQTMIQGIPRYISSHHSYCLALLTQT